MEDQSLRDALTASAECARAAAGRARTMGANDARLALTLLADELEERVKGAPVSESERSLR